MDSKLLFELAITVNKLAQKVVDLERDLSTLRTEHDRFFKNELLNIRNDISDLKRNARKRY